MYTQMSNNEKEILYLTATWCGPCQKIKPEYRKLKQEYKDIAFHEIDVDHNQDLSEQFGVNSIPAFFFVHNKTVVKKFNGADSNKLAEYTKMLANM